MYVPGDKQVFYSANGHTISATGLLDHWQDAKMLRNEAFKNFNVRAAWVMKHNPSQNTVPSLYGNTLRRTKHDVRRLLCTAT